MKKTIILFAATIISVAYSHAQAPNFLWAKSAGGANGDYGESIATDSAGNVYVTGRFYSTSITFGTTVLTNAGSNTYDIFIAKINGVTGIEENSYNVPIKVFPNPTSGKFQLAIGNWSALGGAKGELEIYNVLGEKVYSSIINNQSSIINLESPAGIYFIQVTGNEKTDSQKIIKQ